MCSLCTSTLCARYVLVHYVLTMYNTKLLSHLNGGTPALFLNFTQSWKCNDLYGRNIFLDSSISFVANAIVVCLVVSVVTYWKFVVWIIMWINCSKFKAYTTQVVVYCLHPSIYLQFVVESSELKYYYMKMTKTDVKALCIKLIY